MALFKKSLIPCRNNGMTRRLPRKAVIAILLVLCTVNETARASDETKPTESDELKIEYYKAPFPVSVTTAVKLFVTAAFDHLSLPAPGVPEDLPADAVIKATPWPSAVYMEAVWTIGPERYLFHLFYDWQFLNRTTFIFSPYRDVPGADFEVNSESITVPRAPSIRGIPTRLAGIPLNGFDGMGPSSAFPEDAVTVTMCAGRLVAFDRRSYCFREGRNEFQTPPPDFVTGARYLGEEEVEGKKCNVFTAGQGVRAYGYGDHAFVKFYEDKETRKPVKFILFTGVEILVTKFQPKVLLDEGTLFPEYCKEEEA